MTGLQAVLIIGSFLVSAITDAWLLEAEHHGEFWWLDIYGFFALFGFAGCLAIIAVAKLVLGPWLRRGQDYYKRRKPA